MLQIRWDYMAVSFYYFYIYVIVSWESHFKVLFLSHPLFLVLLFALWKMKMVWDWINSCVSIHCHGLSYWRCYKKKEMFRDSDISLLVDSVLSGKVMEVGSWWVFLPIMLLIISHVFLLLPIFSFSLDLRQLSFAILEPSFVTYRPLAI